MVVLSAYKSRNNLFICFLLHCIALGLCCCGNREDKRSDSRSWRLSDDMKA